MAGLGRVTRRGDQGRLTEDGEKDVDQKISAAAALKEDTQRRKNDGKDDLADIAEKSVWLTICLFSPIRDEERPRPPWADNEQVR